MGTYKNLTWQDIQTIVGISAAVSESYDLIEFLSIDRESYYKTVLDQVTKRLDQKDNT